MSEEILRAFARYHVQNPDLYEEILRIARKAKAQGKTRLSMRGLFEFIRFRRSIEIHGDGEFELNNTFTPLYSRMVRQQDPELGALFEIRGRAGMIQIAPSEDDPLSVV